MERKVGSGSRTKPCSIVTTNQDTSRSYVMVLGPNLSWRFHAVRGTEAWLDRLASILGLTECAAETFADAAFPIGPGWRPWRPTQPRFPDLFPDRNVPADGWLLNDLKCVRLWYHPEVPHFVCQLSKRTDRGWGVLMMWYSLYGVFLGLVRRGGFPVHAALVERDGAGALIIAGEGGGKSTCCDRIPPPWRCLGDDSAVVVPHGAETFFAHPFPTWSRLLLGSSQTWDVQSGVPLKAIFFLEKSDRDDVVPLGQGRASVMITEAASYICKRGLSQARASGDGALRKSIFLNACKPAKEVPAFILHASRQGRFWEAMERALYS